MKRIKLKVLLTEKGISQSDLSELTGITKTSISQIINGKQSGSLTTWKRIAEALGVEIGDIIE